ncbi:class I SAM-dependent methyltransferase [Desulfobulbus sp. US4]|nr:class I SAM-dependent methyltransferase [Desulfobulbus sp. US4]
MKCRHCGQELVHTFIDLGSAPPSNSYLTKAALKAPEKWYPLQVKVCEYCWLVQTEDFVGVREMFSEDYAYFSSFSDTWIAHARQYVDEMIARFNLGAASNVVEIAANDGYLLQFVQERNIPCYGIEPTHATANTARDKGIEIVEDFFGLKLAAELSLQGRQADLITANNVLAHVPDINDFVKGIAALLKPEGVVTFEFPHFLNLIEQNQFDTIYHEHYSYLSLTAAKTVLEANGLAVFDVVELSTHGGSLRLFAGCKDSCFYPVSKAVEELLQREEQAGISTLARYAGFQEKAEKIKMELLSFLLDAKQRGKSVAAYGAAAKGNTMLNFAGVRPDLISFVVDKNPEKQGKYMPGSRIPILAPSFLAEHRPDYVVILPWNIAQEVREQLDELADGGTQFVTAVPSLEIV